MENGDLMEANRMKTLHPAYRVTDLDISLGFYTALGYQVLGRADLGHGATLTVLKFPDEPVGTLELVHRPADGAVQLGTGFSHLAIQAALLSWPRWWARPGGWLAST